MKLFGMKWCPCCHMYRPDVATRRRLTAYDQDKLNYLNSCLGCYEQDFEYFEELWQEYYTSKF